MEFPELNFDVLHTASDSFEYRGFTIDTVFTYECRRYVPESFEAWAGYFEFFVSETGDNVEPAEYLTRTEFDAYTSTWADNASDPREAFKPPVTEELKGFIALILDRYIERNGVAASPKEVA